MEMKYFPNQNDNIVNEKNNKTDIWGKNRAKITKNKHFYVTRQKGKIYLKSKYKVGEKF